MFVAVCDQNFGNSTLALLERRAVAAGDQRVAELPLDLVERVAARDREEAPRGDARLLVEDRVDELLARCRVDVAGSPASRSPCCPPSAEGCGKSVARSRPWRILRADRHARRPSDGHSRTGKPRKDAEKRRAVSRRDPTRGRGTARARPRGGRAARYTAGSSGPPSPLPRLRPPAEVAGPAGREQEQRETTEHEQRNRHRGRAGRVDVAPGRRRSPRRWCRRAVGDVPPAGSTAPSGSCSPPPPPLVPPPSAAATRARVAGVGLAALRVRERAEDVLLRVRVVEHVDRERADRVGVAVERVDLVDAPVAVPVGHHRFAQLAFERGRGLAGRQQRQQRQRAARARAGPPSDGGGDEVRSRDVMRDETSTRVSPRAMRSRIKEG